MNPDADQRWVCNRKKAYATEKQAKVAVSHVYAKTANNYIRPYPCTYCGQWHIGGINPEKNDA